MAAPAIQFLFHTSVIPAFALLDDQGVEDAMDARRFVLAVALQETDLLTRRQYGPGPGRGFWQFEENGVRGLMEHERTGRLTRDLARYLVVPTEARAIHLAAENHDALAAGLARLLLWSDPHALPRTTGEAWDTYLRLWRPGRPRLERWGGRFLAATRLVYGAVSAECEAVEAEVLLVGNGKPIS